MILITGASGQLGQCFSKEMKSGLFLSRKDLDISNYEQVLKTVKDKNISTIINCAAYTNVDKSEVEAEIANLINHLAVKNLSLLCREESIKLIHISTDYVFDGSKNTPYTEMDIPIPLGIYGDSKRSGEEEIIQNCEEFLIVRTSWLYSEFQQNFVKTMLKLFKQRDNLSIVFDQVGSPTYARDLAKAIIVLIPQLNKSNSGIYHYSNQGVTSWYDLAYEIKNITSSACNLQPIESHQYPTPAKRPHYSVFNTQKIKNTFNINIPHWKESLKLCLQRIS